jgi:hypothetical protein
VTVGRVERNDMHVQLQQEEAVGAVGEPAVRDDAEVLEECAVRGLVLPEDFPAGAVDREDVVVVRGDVQLSADRERIRLLPLLDVGVELEEVDVVRALQLVDVLRVDVVQRRVAVVVDRAAEREPVTCRNRVRCMRASRLRRGYRCENNESG